VGDLAQLTELEVHNFPIREPKLVTIRNALEKFSRLAIPPKEDINDQDETRGLVCLMFQNDYDFNLVLYLQLFTYVYGVICFKNHINM